MKKIFLSLVIITVVFLISCQENSINNPVSSDQISSLQRKDTNIKEGSIILDRLLVVPGLGNNYYQLNGEINYKELLYSLSLSSSTSAPNVNVDISINATLINPDNNEHQHNTWNISADSDDLIYVSEEGIYLLYKSYPIPGRTDRLELVCTYLITTDGVGLNNIELKVPTNGRQN